MQCKKQFAKHIYIYTCTVDWFFDRGYLMSLTEATIVLAGVGF